MLTIYGVSVESVRAAFPGHIRGPEGGAPRRQKETIKTLKIVVLITQIGSRFDQGRGRSVHIDSHTNNLWGPLGSRYECFSGVVCGSAASQATPKPHANLLFQSGEFGSQWSVLCLARCIALSRSLFLSDRTSSRDASS